MFLVLQSNLKNYRAEKTQCLKGSDVFVLEIAVELLVVNIILWTQVISLLLLYIRRLRSLKCKACWILKLTKLDCLLVSIGFIQQHSPPMCNMDGVYMMFDLFSDGLLSSVL